MRAQGVEGALMRRVRRGYGDSDQRFGLHLGPDHLFESHSSCMHHAWGERHFCDCVLPWSNHVIEGRSLEILVASF